MNRKSSHSSSPYYQFMETAFASGNKEVIAQAKALYRKGYKAQWRKAKRKQIKEITIGFDKSEYKELQDEAKRHKESMTRFVKKATQGYINTRYVTPDEELVQKVVQLLALTYNQIVELHEEKNINEETSKKLQFDIYQLEKDIRVTLYSPKTIEQILKEYLEKHANDKVRLTNYIFNLSI
jgi:hypothetical protein